MVKVDAIKEQIALIEGKLRFFRNAILAISSGLVWSVYAILEKRVGDEILVLSGVGLVILVLIFIRTKSLEAKEMWLIEELEKK